MNIVPLSVLSQRRINRVRNPDVENGRITLGRNSWTANRFGFGIQEYRISIRNKRSGLISIISGHSSGKSVLLKRVYAGISLCEPKRPGLILDMQGIDHRLSRWPSNHGFIFTNIGEYRWGYGKRIKNMTPAYLRRDCYYAGEIFFSIPWKQITDEEWEYLLMQSSDAKSWIQSFLYVLVRAKSRVNRLSELIEAIEEAMWSAPSSRNTESLIPREISKAELQAMLKMLRIIQARKYLVEEDDPEAQHDIIQMLEDGLIVNVSFHSDESIATKLYTGHILRRVYEHYNRKSASAYPRLIEVPWLVVEEFNKLSPANVTIADAETPGQKWIREIVTKGMKIGFKLLLVMQDAHDINNKMRRNIFNDTVMVCNLTVPDMRQLISRYGEHITPVLQSLDTKFDEMMAKEWALIQDGDIITFRPAASPVEFHERFANPKKAGGGNA